MEPRPELVMPGLFDLPLAELEAGFLRDDLPHINRFLRFATPLPANLYDIDRMIAAALGWPHPDNQGLPVAQAFDRSFDANRMLIARALHLLPDMHNAIAVPIEIDAENLEDIHLIINDLGELFKEDCDVEELFDGWFLMKLKQADAPAVYPHLLSVAGKPVNCYIEQVRESLPWYRLMNEMQMFLHQHPVNSRRIQQGRTTINSLWFWGAGQCPEADPGIDWYCDDSLLNQFAVGAGMERRDIAHLRDARPGSRSIVVDLRLLECLKSGQASEIEPLLRSVDADIFKPLQDLGKGFRLRSGFDRDFLLGSRSGLRFWRTGRSLLDFSP